MDTLWDQRLLQLVDEALGMSREAQAAFLDQQCEGDATLRGEAESLLASDVADWTLGAPPAMTAIRDYVARSTLQVATGETIEGFRLGREIGSGGMGVVYEAEQASPQRTVALKLLHARLVGTGAGERFAFESEVLARLSHPNIAQVLQAGTYEIGDDVQVPWFALELVEQALPITEYCSEHSLPTDARLRLFSTVCDAIHHGHQHGVIHRDLKPANVLVNGDGRVKVIDFSIAAATNRAESVTMLTRTGDLLGTLPYMSPELVTGPRDGVDTRTDVYALGVLLFELLTGQLPIDMAGMSLADSVRQIVEQPCRRPSVLKPSLSRELDWIALKALEKEPGRRYASASELQADVDRFLAGEAVQAGQPSVMYGVVKALQRHPVVASVGGLLLIGSLSFGAYQSRVADDQTRMAAEQARLKDEALVLAQQARAKQAEAHVLAAGIAAEQGLWGAVVESLDQALALGVEDTVGLGFERIGALVAMGDYPQATDALDAIEDQEGGSGQVGRLIFYHGVLALAEKESRDEGLPLLELALGRTLPPADAAFARGMTAPTADQAIASFKEAIALDSAHPLAWGGLLNALVAAGRLREAERMAESLRFRFPRDKRVHAYHVLFAGLSGDEQALATALDEARPWMSTAELRLMPTFASWMLELDRVFRHVLETGDLGLPFLSRSVVVLMASQHRAGLDEEVLLGSMSLHQRFIVDSFGGLGDAFGNLLVGRWDKATKRLDKAIAVNRSPLLRFIRGLLRTFAKSVEFEATAADYAAAADELGVLPSLALFARFGELRNRIEAWNRDGKTEQGLLVHEAIREMELVRDVPPPLLRSMADFASILGTFDQCRAIISRWQRAAPDDLNPLRLRIMVEIQARNWLAARQAILDLLSRLPPDAAECQALRQQLADVQKALEGAIAAPLAVPGDQSKGGD